VITRTALLVALVAGLVVGATTTDRDGYQWRSIESVTQTRPSGLRNIPDTLGANPNDVIYLRQLLHRQ